LPSTPIPTPTSRSRALETRAARRERVACGGSTHGRIAPARAGELNASAVDPLDLLQWPAMAVTVLAAWLVASNRQQRRSSGFWAFLLSNGLWVAWGWYSHAWALVILQFCLAAMNIRGVRKTEAPAAAERARD